jgi:hypothetical protein
MKKYIILSLLLAIGVDYSLMAGGGWTPKKKKGFFKFGQNILRSNKFYSPSGDIIDVTTISLYTTSLYGEYGLTDRLAAIMYAPLFVRNTINKMESRQTGMIISDGDMANSIGDLDLGIKYALVYNKKIAVSTSLTLGIPTGITSGGEGEILQTGDGEFNQLLKIEASKSFYPVPMYVSAAIGFNNRTKGFSEEFHFGVEVGYTFNERLTTTFKVYNVSSFKNGNSPASAGNAIFSNETEFFSYGPEISYKLKGNFGISGSAAYALSGKRILAAPNYNLGVFITL